MTIYTVLEPPDGKPDRVAFIPEGFAWGALALTIVWALWHRMWVVAARLFAVSAAVSAAVGFELLAPIIGSLVQTAIALLFGFEAGQLRVMSLERSGFRRAGLIRASSVEAAELAYFAGRAPSSPPPPASLYRDRGASEDTLGIFGNV